MPAVRDMLAAYASAATLNNTIYDVTPHQARIILTLLEELEDKSPGDIRDPTQKVNTKFAFRETIADKAAVSQSTVQQALTNQRKIIWAVFQASDAISTHPSEYPFLESLSDTDANIGFLNILEDGYTEDGDFHHDRLENTETDESNNSTPVDETEPETSPDTSSDTPSDTAISSADAAKGLRQTNDADKNNQTLGTDSEHDRNTQTQTGTKESLLRDDIVEHNYPTIESASRVRRISDLSEVFHEWTREGVFGVAAKLAVEFSKNDEVYTDALQELVTEAKKHNVHHQAGEPIVAKVLARALEIGFAPADIELDVPAILTNYHCSEKGGFKVTPDPGALTANTTQRIEQRDTPFRLAQSDITQFDALSTRRQRAIDGLLVILSEIEDDTLSSRYLFQSSANPATAPKTIQELAAQYAAVFATRVRAVTRQNTDLILERAEITDFNTLVNSPNDITLPTDLTVPHPDVISLKIPETVGQDFPQLVGIEHYDGEISSGIIPRPFNANDDACGETGDSNATSTPEPRQEKTPVSDDEPSISFEPVDATPSSQGSLKQETPQKEAHANETRDEALTVEKTGLRAEELIITFPDEMTPGNIVDALDAVDAETVKVTDATHSPRKKTAQTSCCEHPYAEITTTTLRGFITVQDTRKIASIKADICLECNETLSLRHPGADTGIEKLNKHLGAFKMRDCSHPYEAVEEATITFRAPGLDFTPANLPTTDNCVLCLECEQIIDGKLS
ncbi:hypothetical protein [Salinibaculum rarum]|uniref:hypothetical protein n=1 Tax=Salinibaculum rarum TaxID=3058903 RepID=UPI00265F96B0|nr:hypothetical protein [Salinibaculum sp. KK48]